MLAKISAKLAETLQITREPYDVRDESLKGFLIRVYPSGIKSYVCEFARGKRQTLGRVGVITAVQARDKAKELLASYQLTGTVTPRRPVDKLTFKAFIEDEYRPWAEAHNKSADENLDRIRRLFFDEYGTKALDEITASAVEHWQAARVKSGVRPSTVNRDLAALKATLSKAVQWGHLDRHPLARVRRLKTDSNPITRYLTEGEETSLRNALQARDVELRSKRVSANQWRQVRGYTLLETFSDAEYPDHLTPMVLLTMNTGLRRGELFGLRWADVDLENRNLTVAGSYSKSGKTRHIPLNDEAYEVLQQWQAQSGGKPDLVFGAKWGGRLTNIKKSWGELLKDAGIENFRWHDLRHHFASKLVMASVDLNTVRELLGHSTITMTLRYAHLAPEHKANAVAKIAYGTSTKGKVIPFLKRDQANG